jgi:hypothetical protein
MRLLPYLDMIDLIRFCLLTSKRRANEKREKAFKAAMVGTWML